MPPKRDLRLIDEYFKSVCVDVISNIAPGDVKTVESKHKTVDVNHKVVFSIVEPKPIRKNSFSPPIIEDWHSDDESEGYACNIGKGKAIRTTGVVKTVGDYNANPLKEKMLLAQKQEARIELDNEQQDFMVDGLEEFDRDCEDL
nr:hypothetical protein [Tanacetum cinerariifolium]